MATQAFRYTHSIAESVGTQATSEDVSELIRESLSRSSEWAQTARRLVSEHAAHDNSEILEGEPGTGRKFLASLIHRCSSRREGPFVTVALGCAAEEVARRVLFGSEAASFDEFPPGEKGLIELAAGGTLYIDGLLDKSPRLTGDVTRFIENGGSNREGDKSVRVLFGSTIQSGGCHWRTSISARTERLSCERIQIPPLRERRDDIEALAAHFLKECCEQMRKELRAISPDAIGALRNYEWPRNVTELRLAINHLVRQARPTSLDVTLLPAYMQAAVKAKNIFADVDLDLDNEVKQFEISLICAALKQSRGLQNKAAQLLRIRPTTLFMKIKRYHIEVADFR